MTPRALRWATGGVAALSVALLLGGLPLAYLGRHVATAGPWNFPDVFEELTFVAVPVVGFVLASRRPANKIGWIILAAGLLLGLGFQQRVRVVRAGRGTARADARGPGGRMASELDLDRSGRGLRVRAPFVPGRAAAVAPLAPGGLVRGRRVRAGHHRLCGAGQQGVAGPVRATKPGMGSGLALRASCAVAGRHSGRRCRTGHQICPVVRRGAVAAEVVRGGCCARCGHDYPAGGGTADIVATSRWRAVGGPAQGVVLPGPGVPVGGHRRGDLEVQALRDRRRGQQGTAVRHARCVHLSRLRRTGGRRRLAGWRPAQPAAVSNCGRRRGGDLPSRSAAGRAACEPDRVRQAGQPYQVLSEFARRIGGGYARDVLAQMATIVAAGTGAQRVVVWLPVGSELRPEAASGGSSAEPFPVDGHQLPTLPDIDFGALVLYQGELLGAISIRMPRDEPLNPAAEQLVIDVASQAGLALSNAGLIEDLRASRQRLVAAQDEARRRLERNLHDGAQQDLVALPSSCAWPARSWRRAPRKPGNS
jgi:hypothetical protein